jgi:multidrug efflux pump subunit AcrA (membrane-fusion protein)
MRTGIIPAWAVFLLLAPLAAGGTLAGEGLFVKPATERVELSGYTRSGTTVVLVPEVTGRVLKVNYQEGDTIGEAPVVEIDTTFVDFSIEATQKSLKKLDAAISRVTASMAYLEKEYARMEKLHKNEQATEVNRDAAEHSFRQAVLEREALMADREALAVTLKELAERKKRHKIQAPQGYVLVGRHVEPGELAAPGNPVARVGDYQELVVPLSVSSAEYKALKAFPKVFEARLEGAPVKARVHWVNPEFNEQTRKLAVELALTDYAGERRGGLKFSLALNITGEGLAVPAAAVLNQYENPKVRTKAGETVPVIVTGGTDGWISVAPNPKIGAGTELLPADAPETPASGQAGKAAP